MHEVFTKLGLTFIKINESHLEMVRNWRNSDFVRNGMLFQDHITPEMQEKWFRSIDNDKNYYFIVRSKDENLVVANVKDIENNMGEPGFYLVDEKYKNTSIASFANLALLSFLFDVLHLEKLYIHVRKDNPEALKFNEFFGYKIVEEKCSADSYYMELTKAEMLKNPKIKMLMENRNK